MRGEQPPRRARVDEAVQVMQQDRSVQLRRPRVNLVKVPRIRHHAHAPPTASVSLRVVNQRRAVGNPTSPCATRYPDRDGVATPAAPPTPTALSPLPGGAPAS